MHNVTMKAAGSKLVIEIDMASAAVKNAPLSKTGKTRLLATTAGAQPVECNVPGLKVALNVMIPTA